MDLYRISARESTTVGTPAVASVDDDVSGQSACITPWVISDELAERVDEQVCELAGQALRGLAAK